MLDNGLESMTMEDGRFKRPTEIHICAECGEHIETPKFTFNDKEHKTPLCCNCYKIFYYTR